MESSSLLIREYEDADEAGARELERKCPQGHSVSFVMDMRGKYPKRASNFSEFTIFVCETDKRIAGIYSGGIKTVIYKEEELTVGYGFSLRVDPEYRGKGIAKKLITRMEEWFLSKGVKLFTCNIVHDNTASQRLYSSMGYNRLCNFSGVCITVQLRAKIIPSSVQITSLSKEEAIENLTTNYTNYNFRLSPKELQDLVDSPYFGGCLRIKFKNDEEHEAIMSIWKTADVWQLTVTKLPTSSKIITKAINFMSSIIPFVPSLPDMENVVNHWMAFAPLIRGSRGGELLRILFDHILNLARENNLKLLTCTLPQDDPILSFVPSWNLFDVPSMAFYKPVEHHSLDIQALLPVFLDPREE